MVYSVNMQGCNAYAGLKVAIMDFSSMGETIKPPPP